jgi:hypothetical protein
MKTRHVALVASALIIALTGCSSHSSSSKSSGSGSPSGATETNPAGDIPDNQAYVPYTSTNHLFEVSVPEGWAQTTAGQTITFSDKYNHIRLETRPAATAPTTDSATSTELPAIGKTVNSFSNGAVKTAQRKAGPAILLTYQDLSAPNTVTGKTVVEDVERYEFWHAGQEVIVTLSSAKGSDNVDPWRKVTDSLRWL